MRLRRILVLDKKSTDIVFTRTFYVNEALAEQDKGYCIIPSSNSTLLQAFLEKYNVENEYTINFKPVRDTCDRPDWFPVFSLKIEDKAVWPVVFITNSKYIFIGIPLMKLTLCDAGFLEHPEIAGTIELMDTFANILKSLAPELLAEQFDMEDVLNFVAPYGLLTNSSVSNFKIAISGTANLNASSKEYLQSSVKLAPLITVTIKESAKGTIYNRKRLEDKFDYTGTVLVTSTLPVTTDISATLLTTLDITHIVPGPSLENFSNTASENQLQLFLNPGYDTTEVFKYRFEQVKPPIAGAYKVTKVNTANHAMNFTLDLQFFLEQKITFEYIEVIMPFPNRGGITSLSYEPQSSNVFLNKNKNQIIWRRPKPPITDKLSLSGSLTLDMKHSAPDGHPQLRDINAYADIKFKSTTTTMSKMRLDTGSVTVFPANKFKLNYTVESSGSVLRIWNVLGEVMES